ncbi:MAG: chromosomal replication initiator protein DnaA [Clostridia bacterium]|nr:chromosomal replication initiator protein DnaA [Clostridia bacterium]
MDKILLDIWTQTLQLIADEPSVSAVAYNTWIKNIVPVSLIDKTLTLSVESVITKNMIDMRYSALIKNAVAEVSNHLYDIVVVVSAGEPMPQTDSETKNPFMKYTFDNFVVGSSNKFAQTLCLAVAEAPGVSYSPLFLYGGVGLGKTHLMHAIKNYITSNNPDAKIVFISAETFTNDLISAIGNKTMADFRHKYRNVDVLLIDDVQFIAGKTSTEEEFFHTFNSLYESNKQIVFTADRTPREMKSLEERLISRFEWGVMCEVLPPDYETRIAILKQKAQDEGVIVADEILAFIAENIKSNIRELEGVFNRVVAYSGLVNKDITVDLASEALKDYCARDSKKAITPEYIVEKCAAFYKVNPQDILSQKKTGDVAFARQIVFYICREITDLSLKKIGSSLGGRDHSTVLYGIKKIQEQIDTDIVLKSNIKTLISDIKGE